MRAPESALRWSATHRSCHPRVLKTWVDGDHGQQAAATSAGSAPDRQLDAWISTYLQIASGELDIISDAVLQLTGHQPISLAQFLAPNTGLKAGVRRI